MDKEFQATTHFGEWPIEPGPTPDNTPASPVDLQAELTKFFVQLGKPRAEIVRNPD